MKQVQKLSLLALVALLSVVLMAPAPSQAQEPEAELQQGVPGSGFVSAFRVLNLNPDTTNMATCDLVVYDHASGTEIYQNTLPEIPGGSSTYVHTRATAGADGWSGKAFPDDMEGAAVLNCTEDVAAVVNFQIPGKWGDTFIGVSQDNVAEEVLIPMAYNNFYEYDTSIRIQNTTNQALSGVTVEYYTAGQTNMVDSQSVNIPANGAVFVDQAGQSNLQENVAYSARITSPGGGLAVIGTIFGRQGGGVQNQLYAFSAFKSGSTSSIQAPVIMADYYGNNTATTIQNASSDTATDVQVSYGFGKSFTYSEMHSGELLQPRASWVVEDFKDADLLSNDVNQRITGAVIQSTGDSPQPLIVTVNESDNVGLNRASTYEGQVGGATKILVPLVMRKYYGYNSSVTCKGTSSNVTSVDLTYTGTAGSDAQPISPLEKSFDIGSTNGVIYQGDEADLPELYSGSLVIEAASPIVCVVNQDLNDGSAASDPNDELFAYNGILGQ
ncbi:MAG: hypothetical protein HC884_11160 [Chloroflexaceae bacterium]|nr:hypothetical protein [Chloroflexaceae bacterium]